MDDMCLQEDGAKIPGTIRVLKYLSTTGHLKPSLDDIADTAILLTAHIIWGDWNCKHVDKEASTTIEWKLPSSAQTPASAWLS